jgi:C4-dicarboxylate-specific signal transduction histidine kinase
MDAAHVGAQRVTGLGVLAASIAHEVNQPLFGIATNASACLRMLCADPPDVEGARETARRTLRDVERAVAVISRMRALFTDHGEPAGAVDLNATLRELLASMRQELREAGVVVHRSLADRLPCISGDGIQLELVMRNLIRNASEAMAGVRARERVLSVTTRMLRDGTTLLGVHDVWVGIAEQDRQNVFKPFHSTKPRGMGIGLCISRAIVERHGGQLWMTANDGPGVTFWMSIPSARRCPANGAVAEASLLVMGLGLPVLGGAR